MRLRSTSTGPMSMCRHDDSYGVRTRRQGFSSKIYTTTAYTDSNNLMNSFVLVGKNNEWVTGVVFDAVVTINAFYHRRQSVSYCYQFSGRSSSSSFVLREKTKIDKFYEFLFPKNSMRARFSKFFRFLAMQKANDDMTFKMPSRPFVIILLYPDHRFVAFHGLIQAVKSIKGTS